MAQHMNTIWVGVVWQHFIWEYFLCIMQWLLLFSLFMTEIKDRTIHNHHWSLLLYCRLLTHMLWDYRCEKWWLLLTNILTLALNCAFLSANIQDYIVLSLEALGTSSMLSPLEKTRIFNNIMKVLKVSSNCNKSRNH